MPSIHKKQLARQFADFASSIQLLAYYLSSNAIIIITLMDNKNNENNIFPDSMILCTCIIGLIKFKYEKNNYSYCCSFYS